MIDIHFYVIISSGIASAGGNCTVADKPGVFDDVGKQVAWIKGTMQNQSYPYQY